MKKKFIIFTLCFTLIFSSINYKKSYADMGVISAPMVATVITLAGASGIILNNSDDIVEFVDMFYQKHKDSWNDINSIFNACVKIGVNGVVTVGKDFLDKVLNFFDGLDVALNNNLGSIEKLGGFTVGSIYNIREYFPEGERIVLDFTCKYPYENNFLYKPYFTFGNNYRYLEYGRYNPSTDSYFKESSLSPSTSKVSFSTFSIIKSTPSEFEDFTKYIVRFSDTINNFNMTYHVSNSLLSFDYSAPGVYDKGFINDNVNDDGSVGIYVPGNVGDIVGSKPNDLVYDGTLKPPFDLPLDGVVSVPNVNNPSIDIDSDITFPTVGDVPGVDSPSVPSEGIWSTIKDFIVGLVVPSDTFWTDTWGGLYNNFTNSFPMVDMDGFNDLVTGEKKFPNIDINIMGVSGRVVNGDVVNSIVDWLRPIVAGFMMLCLMLFNYRKIYKLIRNSEPFGGIAPGTSDFSTGISEYSKQEVVKATDMVAEYRAWRERGGK